jgi:hypothetical protein
MLLRLAHGIQYPEIVLSVLEKSFRHNPVSGAGRIPTKLQILLEQLLGGATQPYIRAIRVKHMIAVHRRVPAVAILLSATAAAAMPMSAASHPFHVHRCAVWSRKCRHASSTPSIGTSSA